MKPLAERLTGRELIQRGDLSLAFRARDAVLDRLVFVKCLNPALAGDPEIRARFEREAKAVARLDHPNLVRIYEYGEDPAEGLFMLLEWLEGETLAQRIAGGERFAGDAFTNLALQLLRGLAVLHSVHILHRDLKPDNVLIKHDGTVKITDFSLAALRDTPKLTHHEAIVGTPAYMSPEQAAGGNPDERSDLFSLGVVLWEAATGESPFAAGSVLDTLRAVRERALDFQKPAIRALPERGRELLEKLLLKDAGARPASARNALEMLGEHLPSSPARRRITKRDWQHLIAAIALVLIWAVLMWAPWRPHKVTQAVVRADSTSHAAPVQPPPVSNETQTPALTEPKETAVPPQESRDLAAIETKQHDLKPAPLEITAAAPDTAELSLTTEPWAHVYLDGVQIGTTPLAQPLRLAGGKHELVLRNPAFPAVTLAMNLSEPRVRKHVRLADSAALVQVNVQPWGELYVDGEPIGTTPLARPLWVSSGGHSLRVIHPQFPALQQEFTAAAGETLAVDMNLATAQTSVKGRLR